ncbi:MULTISPECIES: helix-turn-helix domain-containing protein [Protofrankia]|uniref:Transcriptional regulator n=1 Tax=Protofrankia coriariae TaxID=1562887 RepID=A0ABR5F283_9ACTN|nr:MULTISPECIES: helix-turn-helix domain-containing protein [Protofrankia]KLL10832.1 transcriptional regulator [Protofrankia coriariae]ONH34037.1 transcriptional regulator [Protofrankia sp. BMG5.30]
MHKLLLTPAEAAAELRVSRAKLYQLMKAGLIDSVLIDRSRRIPRAALVTYVDRLRGRDGDEKAA